MPEIAHATNLDFYVRHANYLKNLSYLPPKLNSEQKQNKTTRKVKI